jgi:Nuclease A inhibitor-like protein
MDFPAFVKQLHKATTGLFFVSESEYPVEVIEPGKNITAAAFVSSLPKPVSSLGAKDFFESYIRNMRIGGDNGAAEKYENLYALVSANASSVIVLRSGRIKIGVYILITAGNQLVVLKTQAIET